VTEATIGRVEVLWEKLRRRKVVQWGVAYCLFAWGLLQGLEYLSDTFGWPQLLQQLATLAFLIGLPIMLVVAWYHGDRGEQQVTPAEFLILFGLLLLGGTLFWWFGTSRVSTMAHGDGSSAATSAPDRSIAVLPFDNLSGDPADEFLGDGLAEELANRLTRVPDLQVASRTSAFAFKGKQFSIEQIAAELGVRYVIEGSIRRNGDTLLVTSQLIDGPSGFHVWSKTYRRPIEELQNVEDEISGAVIEALRIMLSPETLARISGNSTQQDAYEAYLQGISELRQLADEGALDRAAKLFQDAVAIDPTYAEAYAGLCETNVQRYVNFRVAASIAAAERACEQAAKLDSGLPGVHAALGRLYVATGQTAAAEREYRRAMDLDPDNVDANLGLGAALASKGDATGAEHAYLQAIRLHNRYWRVYDAYGAFLFQQGRWPAAIAQYRRGVELAPRNATLFSNLGAPLFLSGDFAGAADAFRRSVEIAPTSEGYSNTGTSYYYAARYGDAVAMFEQATRLAPEDPTVWGNLGDAYRRMPGQSELAAGAYARAAELARGALRVNPDSVLTRTQLAYYLVRQGDNAQAATELETAGPASAEDVYAHYFAALSYKELGNLAAAVTATRRAVASGYPARLLQADPEFAVINRDPALASDLEAASRAASP
jgi:TolB-like protein/Flp pilus assembly protein TadD